MVLAFRLLLTPANVWNFSNETGCRIYVDIMTGEHFCQFILLTWNAIIGQFVNPEGGEGIGIRYFSPLQIITLLENMKILCRIQVTIYPLSWRLSPKYLSIDLSQHPWDYPSLNFDNSSSICIPSSTENKRFKEIRLFCRVATPKPVLFNGIGCF